jgi:hypothetical protein
MMKFADRIPIDYSRYVRRHAELAREAQHIGGSISCDFDERIGHAGAGAARDHQAIKVRIFRCHLSERLLGSDPVGVCHAVGRQGLHVEYGQQAQCAQLGNDAPPLVDGVY